MKRVIPLVVAATLLAAAVVSAPNMSGVDAELAAGDTALARLDLAAALVAYRSAVNAAPDSFEATWRLARSLADQATLSKEHDQQKALCLEAERFARKAVTLNTSDSKGHAILAVAVGKLALFEGGKRKVELSKEVKAEADAALRCDPNDDVALHVLAIWNREMVELSWFLKSFAQLLYGRFPPASLDAAVDDLTRATVLRPAVIPHHVELGITLASAKRWTDAKAELEKGLALPTGWVTDDYYRALARANLTRVNSHVR